MIVIVCVRCTKEREEAVKMSGNEHPRPSRMQRQSIKSLWKKGEMLSSQRSVESEGSLCQRVERCRTDFSSLMSKVCHTGISSEIRTKLRDWAISRLAGKRQLLLSGSIILKRLKDTVL